MRSVGSTHEFAHHHKLYCSTYAVTLRTAQSDRKNNTKRWLEFVSSLPLRAMDPKAEPSVASARALANRIEGDGPGDFLEPAPSGYSPSCRPPPCMQKAEHDRTSEEQNLCEIWLALHAALRRART